MIQARAEATRQAILDAGVRLFGEAGYCNTALNDIIEAAGVTKGATYYHFRSKEAVAVALVEQADARVAETVAAVLAHPGPALENLIRSTFFVADLSRSDPAVRVGMQLPHALPQVSNWKAESHIRIQTQIIDAVRATIAEGDLRADLDPEDLGRTLFAAFVGNHLTFEASGLDPRTGLVTLWRILLTGILAGDSAAFFTRFLDRIGVHHPDAPL